MSKKERESFLTYISCDVHKNAAFETFRGGNRSLECDTCGQGDFCHGQGESDGGLDLLCTGEPSPRLSVYTIREGGVQRVPCSCVPVLGVEVMEI